MRPSPMSIQVLLFARYAELLGQDRLKLNLPEGATVADAIARVRALPGGERLPAHLLVALDLKQVATDAKLSSGDEMALLPPLSGG